MAESGAYVVRVTRYPVKAMTGEDLSEVQVDARGLVGDRWYAVEDAEGRFGAGKNTTRFRRMDPVLEYAAATAGREVRVSRADSSWAVDDPALTADLSRRTGRTVRVRPEGGVQHQDAGQVSLVSEASLAWCAAELGVDADARRVRPNLLLGGMVAFAEDGWVGREIEIGTAVLRVVERIERCRVVNLAQNGVTMTTPFLTALSGSRELCLGVYADVVTPGRVRVGDGLDLRIELG